MKNVENENRQKHIIVEGFRQNGLHHWIQRTLLRIVAPVKSIFRHVFGFYILVIRIITNCVIVGTIKCQNKHIFIFFSFVWENYGYESKKVNF